MFLLVCTIIIIDLTHSIYSLVDALLVPRHVSEQAIEGGFTIGGLTNSSMRSKYSRKAMADVESPYKGTVGMPDASTSYSSSKSASMSVTSSNTSFVLNEDMSKIRQAEMVILSEETKFGKYRRDPRNKVVHEMQVRGMREG